jgi:hypothetical protein
MPPRGVAIERSLSAFAIPFADVTPSPRMALVVAAIRFDLLSAAIFKAFTAKPLPYRR